MDDVFGIILACIIYFLGLWSGYEKGKRESNK